MNGPGQQIEDERRVSNISQISALEEKDAEWRPRSVVSPIQPADPVARNTYHKIHTGDSINSIDSFKENKDTTQIVGAKWLPYTLRGYLVWIPTALSFILGLVVIFVYWYSNKHNGLSAESSAVLGWKFVPTLLAVLYSQLTTMLFDDVKRTEPFARLAIHDREVPSATHTILETPRLWWVTLRHAFNKRRNGGKRSWTVILSCIINVLAFMVISPLSSVLLNAQDVNISRPFEMTRLIPKKDTVLNGISERDTYFRTTGALLQNVSTSPWISDEYTVLPFWPLDVSGPSWDRRIPSIPEMWQAETTVFRNELQCAPMKVAATDVWNTTAKSDIQFQASLRLESSGGCQYNISLNATALEYTSTISWSDIDSFADVDHAYDNFRPNYNDKCRGDEVIFLSSKWLEGNEAPMSPESKPNFLSNLTVTSYMCYSNHTMATIPVTASLSHSTFNVAFDEGKFRSSQQLVPENLMNHSEFQQLYTTPKWYQYVASPSIVTSKSTGGFSGASALLATQYEFNETKLMTSNSTLEKAARIRRRHFGEILRTSMENQGSYQTENVRGQKTTSERRITVKMELAATVAALLWLSTCMLLCFTWLSRLAQRPLNLTHDPATVLGCTTLIASNKALLSSLRGLDQATQRDLELALQSRQYSTTPGHLHESGGHGQPEIIDVVSKERANKSNRIPAILKLRTLSGLLLFIVALLVTIAALYRFANESFLHKSLFTYRVRLNSVGVFVPFSIIPTSLGIILGLWWNSLDNTLRTIQPYVSMSKYPTEIRHGAAVSYQSSHWLWAAAKAANKKHWLLSLVTFGTFVAQALIIAMSALFEQDIGYLPTSVELNRTLELRQTPHLRQVSMAYPPSFGGSQSAYGYTYVGTTLEDLFTNLTTNWMYTAEIQLTMDGPEPTWSKDGWSFVPVNLSHLDNGTSAENDTESDTDFTAAYYSPVNVTLTTPSIRGRVECTPIEEVKDTKYWLETRNYTNSRTNSSSNVTVPAYVMFSQTLDYTPLAPDGQYISCCYNQTEPLRMDNLSMPIALGYWTNNFNVTKGTISVTGANSNFTVKWIHGEGGIDDLVSGVSTLMFPQQPRMQALNCMPVMETSEAEITVDKDSGRVESYRLLKDPVPDDSAWSDSFVVHNLTDPNDPVIKAQLTNSADDTTTVISQNITTSYGVLFLNSLLRASRLTSLGMSTIGRGSMIYEHLSDNVFNIRNNHTGLNLDFMSYASYMLAEKNAASLTDADVLLNHTQKTFTTFLQHYVSSRFSLESGGWVYQPIGTNMDGIGPAIPGTTQQMAPNGKLAVPLSQLPAQNTQRNMTATMTTRVEVLHMNYVAFWVCVALLAWLTITTLTVVALQRSHLGDVPKNVETIADVLVLVAGSERLLALVRKKGVDGLRDQSIKTRFGPFRDAEGRMRWGIEVVEDGEVLMK